LYESPVLGCSVEGPGSLRGWLAVSRSLSLALALVVTVVAIWSKDGCSNGDAGRENGDSGSGFGSKGLGVRGGSSLKGLGVLPCWE
jgi:hypothetical protein